MAIQTIITIALSLAALATATPAGLDKRAPCNVNGQAGTCMAKTLCKGTSLPGAPPNWPCAGDNSIECCVAGGAPAPPPPPGPGGDSVGSKMLAKAQTVDGMPYAWGGGSCAGPSHDNPPYQYGDTGFDCSGLVCWSLCQVTGRDLFKEGLRNTHTMYCSDEATLKYQKVPFEQRQPGDAIFFGGSCDCANSKSIHHVALAMDGDNMYNAPNDQINRVTKGTISGMGEKPCPMVVRFT